MPHGLGFVRSGIRQEFRLLLGKHAPPKVMANSATTYLGKVQPASLN